MAQYIDKDALVAEIEKLRAKNKVSIFDKIPFKPNYEIGQKTGAYGTLGLLLDTVDTLEVIKVEEKFEHPNIKIKDTIEVSSRMKYIDEDLKPIADFIMDYASWNLHKDEWNHPVLEVPLFRVLDALIQKGNPYCES